MDLASDPRAIREEHANAVTHGVGAVVALLGGGALVVVAAAAHQPRKFAAAVVFATTLVLLYLASTLYHLSQTQQRRARMRVLDHCAIYLLIAGTYTPFTLIGLHGPLGWSLFAAVWSLAAAGVVFKLFYTGRFNLLSTAIYIAMGWLVLIAIEPVYAALDGWTFGWLLAGGVFYTAGTFFFHRESIPYSHAIWHLFCIAGSACHYVAVLAQVAPGG